jgi:hypothetical protein
MIIQNVLAMILKECKMILVFALVHNNEGIITVFSPEYKVLFRVLHLVELMVILMKNLLP